MSGGDYNPYAPPKETRVYDVVAPHDPDDHSLASLSQRFAGAMIDSLLVIAAMGLAYLGTESFDAMTDEAKDWVTYLAFVPVELLQSFLIVKSGQSIGKRIAKTKIVLLDGSPAGFSRGVLLRQWVWSAASHIPVIGLWIALETLLVLRRDRRALHDLIAGTRVVRA